MTEVISDGAERIAAAKAAADNAQAVFEQTIRDEVAAGMEVKAVATALGVQNRQRVYAILGRGADGEEATAPTPRPAVYLRGKNIQQATWDRIERAMWARGWMTVKDRTTAWHLARAHVPVVFCDFSAHPDFEVYEMTVGRVRARWAEDVSGSTVAALLTGEDQTRWRREGAEWLNLPVAQVTRTMDLPLISGGELDRPQRRSGELDETAIARMVAAAFDS